MRQSLSPMNDWSYKMSLPVYLHIYNYCVFLFKPCIFIKQHLQCTIFTSTVWDDLYGIIKGTTWLSKIGLISVVALEPTKYNLKYPCQQTSRGKCLAKTFSTALSRVTPWWTMFSLNTHISLMVRIVPNTGTGVYDVWRFCGNSVQMVIWSSCGIDNEQHDFEIKINTNISRWLKSFCVSTKQLSVCVYLSSVFYK